MTFDLENPPSKAQILEALANRRFLASCGEDTLRGFVAVQQLLDEGFYIEELGSGTDRHFLLKPRP